MGLDVYLYRYTKHDERLTAERTREERSESLWASTGKKYEDLSESEKDAVHAQIKADEEANPLPGSAEKIKLDSANYPEHMFKIGYLRSSYNEGGLNSVLRDQIGADLYTVFEHKRDDYHVKVDWASAKDRAADLLSKFNTYIETNGFLRASEIDIHRHHELPKDSKVAVELFAKMKAERKGSPGGFDNFSCRDGTFYLGEEALHVRGLIPGLSRFGGEPCVFVIYDSNPDWYRQALEITVEMCEWVLAQPADPAVEYVLHWSG